MPGNGHWWIKPGLAGVLCGLTLKINRTGTYCNVHCCLSGPSMIPELAVSINDLCENKMIKLLQSYMYASSDSDRTNELFSFSVICLCAVSIVRPSTWEVADWWLSVHIYNVTMALWHCLNNVFSLASFSIQCLLWQQVIMIKYWFSSIIQRKSFCWSFSLVLYTGL